MSLIHWGPLNGNLNDKGILSLALSGQGSIGFTDSGKIGRGASFTSDSHSLKATDLSTLASLTKYSMSCGVYLSNTATNHSSAFLSSGDGNSSSAQVCFGLYNYTSGYGTLLVPNKSGGSIGINLTTRIQLGAGHHYAIVYDGSTTKGYIDGTYIGSYNGGGISSTNVSYYYLGAATYYSGFTMRGIMNDFRIYNHALSAKEVKEISKGLVLHYNFEDEYIEPTTNLFGGRTDFSNTNHGSRSQINATAPTIDTDGNMVLYGAGTDGNHQSYTVSSNGGYITISPSTTYTLSVYVKYSSTNAYFNMYFYERTDSAAVKTNVQRLGCTADEVGKGVLRKLTVTTQSTTTKMYTELNCYKCLATETIVMKNNTVQLEAKDHATPYVNGTRSAGKVYDNSGYGYNGTNNGIIISNDSISGKFSAQFAPDAYIEIPSLPQFNKVTYSMGVKIPSNAQAYRSIFIPKGDPVASGIWLSVNTEGANLWAYQGGNAPSYCKGTSTPLSADTGYLYTHTFDGTTGQNYLNGVAIGSAATYTTRTYIPSGVYTLGDSYTGTTGSGTPFDGKIADFKIYATVLSAEDILSEYNKKAVIDKNGNLFTGEIIETAGSATKIDKNSFIDSNLFATTMTLEDGSLWVPICIHYVPDGLFTGSSKTFYYTERNIGENFGAINDLERPESNQGEFYVMQQSTINGAFSKYRFKQNVSPFSATGDQVNPSKVGTNVTRISATSTNNYAGMYGPNFDSEAMCFANGSNGNGYGCGVRTAYNGGIPGYNGETVKGWQLVYMRISEHKARMFKNGIMIPTDIIEN